VVIEVNNYMYRGIGMICIELFVVWLGSMGDIGFMAKYYSL
jgi:hypothetical protein